MSKYSANFLWGHNDDSVEALGYEFANAKTEEYQKECWDALVKKLSEAPAVLSVMSDDDITQKRKELQNDGTPRTENEYAIALVRWALSNEKK